VTSLRGGCEEGKEERESGHTIYSTALKSLIPTNSPSPASKTSSANFNASRIHPSAVDTSGSLSNFRFFSICVFNVIDSFFLSCFILAHDVSSSLHLFISSCHNGTGKGRGERKRDVPPYYCRFNLFRCSIRFILRMWSFRYSTRCTWLYHQSFLNSIAWREMDIPQIDRIQFDIHSYPNSVRNQP
jgi:hypothetical protein